MPQFEYAKHSIAGAQADAVAVFATKRDEGGSAAAVLTADADAAGTAIGIDLAAELSAVRFDGSQGTVARIPTRGSARATVVLVVGLGDAGEVDLEALRKAAGVAARNATKDSTLALVVPGDVVSDDPAAVAQAMVEGAALGAYGFTRYRSKNHDAPSVNTVVMLPGADVSATAVRKGGQLGEVLARGTGIARDLVNTPPADKRPPALADQVGAIAREAGLKVKIHDEKMLAKNGFGGILGVGQGSSQPPRLVELTYEPTRPKGHVVLVGKGITFDSGGLSLKPSEAMTTMKSDMSGAASIIGAMATLKDLGVTAKVTGLLALAENMPSGHAIRVSDVLTHRGGKTVEVMNTDAEGRLVLADALAYGAESKPDAMIDLATLTGAQIIALGGKIAALMGTDDALLEALERAAAEAGEPVWRLPLPADYRKKLDSEVADLKNIGGREAGTITAGLFLKEFTDGIAWAHLDIAGPAFSEEGDAFYTAKGGTGYGVRTIVRYLLAR